MKKLLLFGAIALSINAFSQVPNYVPANGLVGWWPFDGNANDMSGNAHNGTESGGVTSINDRFANPNSAYSFDGVDDAITVGDANELDVQVGAFSISAWVVTSSNGVYIKKSGDANTIEGYSISSVSSGEAKTAVSYGSGQASTRHSASLIDDGNWHHVVMVFNLPSNFDVYIDGALDNGFSILGNPPGLTGNNLDLLFGASSNSFFACSLDDIGIWNRALTNCEIQDLYYGTNNSVSTVTQNGAQLTADQAGATYQWLDCDNNYAIINGETNQSYTPAVTGNYAVEVNMNDCIDTSACLLVDYTGIEELLQSEKELVKIVDFMGRETEFKPNTPLIFIYSDGTQEKVMKLED